jgi:two-component system, OmpR family, phosphate regulon response regulator PhoB
MWQVLLVEDSAECQLLVEGALAGFNVVLTKASSLSEANGILKKKGRPYFDLILLDLVLPDGDGMSLFKEEAPAKFSHETPIILITGQGELDLKVKAFDLGVDEYLVKPVFPSELRSRVLSRLKKVSAYKNESSVIRKGMLVLHMPSLRAYLEKGSQRIELDLTAKEFKILGFLVRNEGAIFTRKALMGEIWGKGVHVLERTVDSHISALRKKLGAAGSYIESVAGSGYRFAYSEESGSAKRPDPNVNEILC